jgi:hypothetical protein
MSFFMSLFNNEVDRYHQLPSDLPASAITNSLGISCNISVSNFYLMNLLSFLFINTLVNIAGYFSELGEPLIQNKTDLRNEILYLTSLNTITALSYGLSHYVIMTRCVYPESRREVMIPARVRRAPLCYLGPADGLFIFIGGLLSGLLTSVLAELVSSNRKLDIMALNFDVYTSITMSYLGLKTVCLSTCMRQSEAVEHDETGEDSLDNSFGA